MAGVEHRDFTRAGRNPHTAQDHRRAGQPGRRPDRPLHVPARLEVVRMHQAGRRNRHMPDGTHRLRRVRQPARRARGRQRGRCHLGRRVPDRARARRLGRRYEPAVFVEFQGAANYAKPQLMAATLGLVLDCADPDTLAAVLVGRDRLYDPWRRRKLRTARRRGRAAAQAAPPTGLRTQGRQESDALRHRDPGRRRGGRAPRWPRRPAHRGQRPGRARQPMGGHGRSGRQRVLRLQRGTAIDMNDPRRAHRPHRLRRSLRSPDRGGQRPDRT